MAKQVNSPVPSLIIRSRPIAHVISLPAFAPEKELFPVLCFLHGSGEAAPLSIRAALTKHGPLRPGNSPQVVGRFLIVALQLPAPGGDVWGRRSDKIRQVVESVQKQYHGEPKRTYLTGFSYGANGVFDIAIAEPKLWAALWSVDPTRPPNSNLPCPLWISLGEASRNKRPDFMRVIKQLREIRAGESVPDGDFLCEDRSENHTGTAKVAFEEDRIYDWLLSRNRQSSR